MSVAADAPPETGEIVRVRSRRYLVAGVIPAPQPEDQTLVHLSCLEDDAEGEELSVLWEKELDAERMTGENWAKLAQGQFDDPRHFAAYYHTLRWNTVTATDPTLFQAPYRAGIKIDAYQLEPLRKALLLPRVNLFIADDVGLGKTIEAGLIVRELLMRQRIRRIVVAAPPSVVLQWKDELDQRFGLTFVVFDRDFVRRMRQERGFAVKERLQDAPKSAQTAAQLVLCNLQKRLLSSIEAFALTLKVHRKAFEKAALAGGPGLQSRPVPAEAKASALRTLLQSPGADDDEADDSEEDVSAEESAAMESATAASVGTNLQVRPGVDPLARERALLAQMTEAAEIARGKADARVRHLVDWCKKNPDKRVLIFTEYADSKRYLEKQLRAALTPGQDADPRIATFHGGMTRARDFLSRPLTGFS